MGFFLKTYSSRRKWCQDSIRPSLYDITDLERLLLQEDTPEFFFLRKKYRENWEWFSPLTRLCRLWYVNFAFGFLTSATMHISYPQEKAASQIKSALISALHVRRWRWGWKWSWHWRYSCSYYCWDLRSFSFSFSFSFTSISISISFSFSCSYPSSYSCSCYYCVFRSWSGSYFCFFSSLCSFYFSFSSTC